MSKLAKETVIYGGTTAIGKLLNYVLVHIHTHAVAIGPAAYGDYIVVLTRKDFPLSAIPLVVKYINRNSK